VVVLAVKDPAGWDTICAIFIFVLELAITTMISKVSYFMQLFLSYRKMKICR
jgi:hypothetical protein